MTQTLSLPPANATPLSEYPVIIGKLRGLAEGMAPSDYWTGPDDGAAFYIPVRDAEISFGTAYDGYWGNADHTLYQAVEQALLGSRLIDASQCRFLVTP